LGTVLVYVGVYQKLRDDLVIRAGVGWAVPDLVSKLASAALS